MSTGEKVGEAKEFSDACRGMPPPVGMIDPDAFVTNIVMHYSLWETPGTRDEYVLAFDAIRRNGRVIGTWVQTSAVNVTERPHQYIAWMYWPDIPQRIIRGVP